MAFKMNISSPFHTWLSIVDARHNVGMTHRGGTDTIRGGMERGSGKYSITVLAGADDNLGPNLRQLSASVAWHPVLWGF